MSLNARIIATLSPLKIPAYFLRVPDSANLKAPYVMFGIYNERDADFEDDENTSEISYINITYWYKNPSDFSKAKDIKKLMKSAGFAYDGGKDLLDNETGLYGRNLDFIYKEII